MIFNISLGQNQFSYHRPIDKEQPGWNKLTIPVDIYSKISQHYNDVRIFGINLKGDTIEAPYIIDEERSEIVIENLPFKIINSSQKDGQYSFTFALEKDQLINEIYLSFDQENFDWLIDLEGSMDQMSWYYIQTDYRFVAINNENTHYEFSTLKFPDSQYLYFRVTIKGSSIKPTINGSSITITRKIDGILVNESIEQLKTSSNKSEKSTEIEIQLANTVPLSRIQLIINDAFDYYRPFDLRNIIDSVQTPAGWKRETRLLTSGTISSIEEPAFSFEPVFSKKLLLTIYNHDNQPLDINDVYLKYNPVNIIFRIDEVADYFLFYGNNGINKPRYDVAMFVDKISPNINEVQLGDEMSAPNEPLKDQSLLKNKIWLWIAIGLIMIVLGFFTMRMMKS